MSAHTYEESKSIALRMIILLAIITVVEVVVALVGKGYIGDFELPEMLIGGVMIILSVTKAIFIIFEFMHMKYEVKGLATTVLLPTALLIWAVIAFMMEGTFWNNKRAKQIEKNEIMLDGKLGSAEDIYDPFFVGKLS